MGKINPNLTGPYTGKVGKATYYVWDDTNLVRSLAVNPKKSMEEISVAQRLKVAEIGRIAGAMKKVTKLGFPKKPKLWNSTSLFISTNLKAGVVSAEVTITDGVVTEQSVETDFSRLQCAKGSLVEPEVSVTFTEESSTLAFELAPSSEDADPTDTVYVAVLEGERGICRLTNLGNRGEGGSATMKLSPNWLKTNIHVYAFAVDAKGKDASPSVYLPLA